MSITNWSFSKKLIASFSFVVLAFAIVTLLVMGQLADIKTLSEQKSRSSQIVMAVDDMSKKMIDLSGQVRGYLLTRDDDFAKGVGSDHAAVTKVMATLRTMVQAPAQKQGLEDMSHAIEGYMSEAGGPELKLGANPATSDQALAIMKSGANKKWMNTFKAAAVDFEDREAKFQTGISAVRDGAINGAEIALLGGAAGAVLAAILMGWLLSRQIARPVGLLTGAMNKLAAGDNSVEVPATGRKDEIGFMAASVQVFKERALESVRLEAAAEEQRSVAKAERMRAEAAKAESAAQLAKVVESLAAGLEKLSHGDLTFRLDTAFPSDFEQLRSDFNEAVAALEETIEGINGSTGGIKSGADEIAQASDDLSRRTEQQAASLEQTAAALDQITATVGKTAEGANHAREVVSTAKGDAEHSGQVVQEAVAAMGEIQKSSREIGQIIGVIDEIAFQTNLLALNAGVEAARAGDAGRGFAVVASEVRALAQRSAEAAKEIKTLISASTRQVGQGVELVGETGKALTRIVAQISEINSVVADIAVSAQEQATGLHQVNTAVNQMDQVVQQNAAMVEQSTAASHALAQETEQLVALVGRFEVGGGSNVMAFERPAPQVARAPAPAKAANKAPAKAAKTRAVMKTTSPRAGGGGAARKAEPAVQADNWEEF